MKSHVKCMFPECEGIDHARGLCINHYAAARYMVKTGQNTWEQMEKDGVVNPAMKKTHCDDYFLPKTQVKK